MADDDVNEAIAEHLKENIDDRIRMYLGLDKDAYITPMHYKQAGEKFSQRIGIFVKNLIDYDSMFEKMLDKMSDESVDKLYSSTTKRMQQIRKEIGKRGNK